MNPTTYTPDEIRALVAARRAAEVEGASAAYEFVKPFSCAADGLIEYATNPEGRFMFGLHDVDIMTRGFGRGELVYLTGRAHSGKTQVLLNAINNNRHRNVLLFTPDEPSELVLSKLVSITHNVDSERVERQIRAGDADMVKLVQNVAATEFRNLVVVDRVLSFTEMASALKEAEDFWQGKADLVCVDYLEYLASANDSAGVSHASKLMKKWCKDADVPTVCLRQNSRGSSKRGQPAGMGGMGYGGEAEAMFVLEVFRRREDPDLDGFERKAHENTVTVSVDKNKRPPCKTGMVDLWLDPASGYVRALRPSDVAGSTTMLSADEALRTRYESERERELF